MKRWNRIIGTATELGMTMGLTAAGLTLLGLWLGRWLDARLNTRPYATLILLAAGAVAGQVAIYRLAARTFQRLAAQSGGHPALPRDAATSLWLAIKVLALVALPALIGLALGLWIDRIAGSRVAATLILTLGGLILGLLGSWRLAHGGSRELDDKGHDAQS
jgi:predicted F0F1-ATPase subunit